MSTSPSNEPRPSAFSKQALATDHARGHAQVDPEVALLRCARCRAVREREAGSSEPVCCSYCGSPL